MVFYVLLDVLNEDVVIFVIDFCVMFKVCKNLIEVEGVCMVYLCDVVVVIWFLVWYDSMVVIEMLIEIDLVEWLEVFCCDINSLFDISFDIISGVGFNGVLFYYCVSIDSNC